MLRVPASPMVNAPKSFVPEIFITSKLYVFRIVIFDLFCQSDLYFTTTPFVVCHVVLLRGPPAPPPCFFLSVFFLRINLLKYTELCDTTAPLCAFSASLLLDHSLYRDSATGFLLLVNVLAHFDLSCSFRFDFSERSAISAVLLVEQFQGCFASTV